MQIRFRTIKEILQDYTAINSLDTEFINEVQHYIRIRLTEASLLNGTKNLESANTFFGAAVGLNARVKISAANKIIAYLKNETPEPWTTTERLALMDHRLKKIISKYQALGRLPKGVADAVVHAQSFIPNLR